MVYILLECSNRENGQHSLKKMLLWLETVKLCKNPSPPTLVQIIDSPSYGVYNASDTNVYHIEPDQLLYGDVVVNVDSMKLAIVKNYSPQYLHLKFKVMSTKWHLWYVVFLLQFDYSQMSCIWAPLQSSIDVVLPPQSYTNLPLQFRCDKLGVFDKLVA